MPPGPADGGILEKSVFGVDSSEEPHPTQAHEAKSAVRIAREASFFIVSKGEPCLASA
jgi:hypothetical protein